MIQNSSVDRLYLSKGGEGDIYVDRKLPQHQIDGIRFLYRQFKKKNPGVILNDPPGYGKRVQTVLFLNALTGILNKPILILCPESDCERWVKRFREWADLEEPEVIIYKEKNLLALNPLVMKLKVCIMPTSNAHTLTSTRREWSIVVVDDEPLNPNLISRTMLRVDFKIWITILEMKINVEAFYSLYDWLFTKRNLNIRKFVKNSAKNAVISSSSLLLDALMEDTVLRRNDFLTRFIEAEKINKGITTDTSPQTVKTRKNKDATGTKIKRSKRKLNENLTPILNNKTPEKTLVACTLDEENEHSDSGMDIETFIRNTKPIRLENYENYIDNTSESGVDDTTDNEKSGNKTPVSSDLSCGESIRLFEDSRIQTPRKKKTYDFDSLIDIEDSVVGDKIGCDATNADKDNKNVIDYDNSNRLSLVANRYKNRVVDDDLSDEIGEIENDKELMNVVINDDILRSINTMAVDCEVSNNETVTIKLFDDSVAGKPKELISDTQNGYENDRDIAYVSTEIQDVEVNPHKTIDDKIFDIEQTALKKFKGSLLDSIF